MKKLLISLVLLFAGLFFLAGCGEPFLTGFATGAAASKVIAEKAQAEFNASVADLQIEKEKMDLLIDGVQDSELKAYLQAIVDKETVENIEKLKSVDWKDPVVLSGYGLALLSALTAGYQKYQRSKKV